MNILQPLAPAFRIALLLPFATSSLCADTTYSYVSSSAIIFNPERGVYRARALEAGVNFESLRATDLSLSYSRITLDTFRTTPISAARLQEIDDAFGRMRSAGVKGIVRINYNNDSSGIDTTLAWMETHLQQLQPVLEANSDVIAFFQAGMIGAWGEWHSSSSGLATPAGRAAVFNLLMTYFPPDKFIQVRTPRYVNELTGLDVNPLDDTSAFQNTARARIAHHNDCWLASATDYGTYPSNAAARETEKAQLEAHTIYAPWGGETCNLDLNYVQCAYALGEAARFHATYLNGGYHPDVIQEFIDNGCWDDFQRNLGYRLELVSATLPDNLTAGAAFSYQVELKNVGWAPFYNSRPVFLRVLAGSNVLQDIPLTADPRFWRPESGNITISGSALATCDVSANHLAFALWMPDQAANLRADPDYSVQFANVGTWVPGAGHNLLKVAAIEPFDVFSVDGDFSDWANRTPVALDPAGDAPGAQADYTAIWLADDDDYLYLRIQSATAVNWSSAFQSDLYFDTDDNAATGFSVSTAVGSEMLFQAGKGYQQRDGGFNEGQVSGLDFLSAPTGAVTDVEIRISRTATYADGTPIFGPSLKLLLKSRDADQTVTDWFPDDKSGIPHTFTVVSPVTPVFTSVSRVPATAGIRLEATGRPNSIIDIYSSPDLQSWSLLGSCLSDLAGDLLFIDHPPSEADRRYYILSE
ncbi:MAG: DUF4832 domain-containing protein [Verrucomicrobiales bacterium]